MGIYDHYGFLLMKKYWSKLFLSRKNHIELHKSLLLVSGTPIKGALMTFSKYGQACSGPTGVFMCMSCQDSVPCRLVYVIMTASSFKASCVTFGFSTCTCLKNSKSSTIDILRKFSILQSILKASPLMGTCFSFSLWDQRSPPSLLYTNPLQCRQWHRFFEPLLPKGLFPT